MNPNSAILEPFRFPRWTPGGKEDKPLAGLGASFISLKRLTPAGVGGFRDLLKIENRSKNALLRIDGRLGPPKKASGRGFGKNMKI